MKVSKFDYNLPEELIAQHPTKQRDACKLLVYDRLKDFIYEDIFCDISKHFKENDILIINDTKVRPAKLIGKKTKGGGKVEVILLNPLETNALCWSSLVKPARRLPVDTLLSFGDYEGAARIIATTDFGGRIIEFASQEIFDKIIAEVGQLPLPPYIKEPLARDEDYQTVFARHDGSVAAPTAGLHFTESLLKEFQEKGIVLAPITLHIGIGTFKPVKVDKIEEHKMHSEYVLVPEKTVDLIKEKKESGGRVIAVGTTVARSLESACQSTGELEAWQGWTDLFIYPGYNFKAIDGILTNFHLPKSTLLMMICAFGGHRNIMKLYRYAIKREYRFFSFGDATLIL